MQFRIRDVREDGTAVALADTVTLPEVASENANVESFSPVKAEFEARLVSQICDVRGALHATVSYHCSRCLTTFDATLSSKFDEAFTEWQEKADDDIHLVQGEWVVLDDYIAETVQLALEYRPLCKADCKGLCPECGQDLNVRACNCNREQIDPRLEALKDLLSSTESE